MSLPGTTLTKMYGNGKTYEYWKSQSQLKGVKVYLGLFKTELEAHQAYLEFVRTNIDSVNKRYKANKNGTVLQHNKRVSRNGNGVLKTERETRSHYHGFF